MAAQGIPVIILAAGGSVRFGSPKQLVGFRGKTLVENALAAARGTGADIYLVLGAAYERILAGIDTSGVSVVNNARWEAGIASSIRCGLAAVENNGGATYVLIAVADQPLLTSEHLNKLLTLATTAGRNVIGSSYSGTIGTPALFERRYFDDLRNLQGDKGAVNILLSAGDDLLTVPFEDGAVDVDTPADYERLAHDHRHI